MFKIGDKVKIADQHRNTRWYIGGNFNVINIEPHYYDGQIIYLDVQFYGGSDTGCDNDIHSDYLELVNDRKSRIDKLFNEEESTK